MLHPACLSLTKIACAISAASVLLAANAIAIAGDAPTGAASSAVSTSSPSIEKFLQVRAPRSVSVTPGGRVYAIDWAEGVNQLFSRPVSRGPDGEMDQLTNFEDGVSGYAVAPDDNSIIVSAAIGGSEQNDLHFLDAKTGELRTIFSDPNVVYGFQVWLRDSSGFIYSANDESKSDFHLYLYDLDSENSQKLLAKSGYWYAADATEDASRIIVGQYRSVADASVYELDATTGELTNLNLGAGPTYNSPVGYLLGERDVLLISDVGDGRRKLFVRTLADGKVNLAVQAPGDWDIENASLSHERDYLAAGFNENGYRPMRLYKTPGFTEIRTPKLDQGIATVSEIREGMALYSLSNARSPGEAFLYDIEDRHAPTKITTAQTQGLDLSSFTLPTLIEFKSFDGLTIPAFLYIPASYKPGKLLPFIVHFHGGPEGQHRPSFSATTQYFISQGFGVIQPNVRGSLGYGREFHQLDNYKKRWDSVRDGVAAAQWLVDNNYAERGKIAAYGGSYGGFMSVACVVEGGDLFGACVDVVGIVNFKTFLEQTRSYRRKLREAEYGPLSDPEFLASISPINRIDEIKAPMLIAHGLNDPRVPIGEAMQLAVGLQKQGYDPEQVYFPDEGHGFSKLANRLVFYDRVVGFLKEHIGVPSH